MKRGGEAITNLANKKSPDSRGRPGLQIAPGFYSRLAYRLQGNLGRVEILVELQGSFIGRGRAGDISLEQEGMTLIEERFLYIEPALSLV